MIERKKVTFVINNLINGGAEKILVNVLNNLDLSKIEPTLFLFEKEGNYLNDLNTNIRVEYGYLPQKVSKGKLAMMKKFALRATVGINKLSKVIEDQDLVVAFLEKGVTYFTAEACRRAKKPFYSWIHTNLDDKLGGVNQQLSTWAYKRAKKVVCVSNECEQLAIKKVNCLENKIITIYNPIDIKAIIEKGSQPVESFNMLAGQNIIAIGRLSHEKGFDILISAFQKVYQEKKDINLIILGEGPERAALEKQANDLGISERVQMPGFVSNPYAILEKSDVFVLSSRYEGLSTVLIEALSLNKAIVSTKCSGAAEILCDGQYGRLVEINDVESLTNGIKEALAVNDKIDCSLRANIFDKKKIMREIEEILLEK